jgi:uncharacterized protein
MAQDSLIIPLSNFTSLTPQIQTDTIAIPAEFAFQILAQRDEPINDSTAFPPNFDFTGYVPISGSSENGYLGINSEYYPPLGGGMTVMDVVFNATNKRWQKSSPTRVYFSNVLGSAINCSGTVTPWNTLITCEEVVYTGDINSDGYYDNGWVSEINPVTKTLINNQKLWALGNFKHENIVIHPNERTVYQGADSSPNGYLFKFVADEAQNLSAGKLYVYKGSKDGIGEWLLLNNTTPNERNTVNDQATYLGATPFLGIEDVEISPINGYVYLAVKNESAVYRFLDSEPINGTQVTNFELFVGGVGQSYNLKTNTGIVSEPWGSGNDNLAFDNDGNLWVLQDGNLQSTDKNFLWVVDKNHTQISPNVRIFMRTPTASEPTGITFSPDNRFLFMSIQHPSSANNASTQFDINGTPIYFDRDAAIVIARKEHWGLVPCKSNLNLGITKLESGYYQSSTFIHSENNLDSLKAVDFRAENNIQLLPGFSSDAGAIFKAEIKPCF